MKSKEAIKCDKNHEPAERGSAEKVKGRQDVGEVAMRENMADAWLLARRTLPPSSYPSIITNPLISVLSSSSLQRIAKDYKGDENSQFLN